MTISQPRTSTRQLTKPEENALCLLYNVWRLDDHAWVSFEPSRYLPQLRNLTQLGFAELNHFVGYQITSKGIEKAESL